MTSALDIARDYTGRGLRVVPVPDRSKKPGFKNWEQLRLTDADLPLRFNGHPQNIGVLTGEPSNWTVDVDLDHPRAIALAAEYLPATPAQFGRASKQRSHFVYRCTAPVTTKKHKSKSAGMIVELRSTGLQTVFPGSVHESGERIEWSDGEYAEPATVDPAELLEAVRRLAEAVLIELGERSVKPTAKAASGSRSTRANRTDGTPAERCLDSMLRMSISDQTDGSGRLHAAACRTVEHDLDDATALAVVRDYERQKPFPRTWSDEEIIRRIRDAEGKCNRGDALKPPVVAKADAKGIPIILLGTDEFRVNNEAVDALAADPDLHQRGGNLVYVVSGVLAEKAIQRPEHSPRIALVRQPTLREKLTKVAQFAKRVCGPDGEEKIVATSPPEYCIRAIDARGEYPKAIRPLNSIIESPAFRPDGTILCTPGYDGDLGCIYIPSGMPPVVADKPNRDDALAALNLLLDVIADFPFQAPAHKSAFLAALLTPFVRLAYDGCAPFSLIDANTPGCGKGLLADVLALIWCGRTLPVMTAPKNNEEAQKAITSLVLAGDRFVLVDNIAGVFGGAAFEAALTATVWKNRKLGVNEDVVLPLLMTWIGTGNNCTLTPDMTRRINHIRLNTEEERPETRTGFKHPDLRAFVTENRPSFVAACLTIIRAYIVAGRPPVKMVEWGSFEQWSKWVRRPLIWLGQTDPGSAREELRSRADQTSGVLKQLIEGMAEADPAGVGITSSQIARYTDPKAADQFATLRDAVMELCGGSPTKLPTVGSIGSNLRKLRGRNAGGRCIDSKEDRKGAAVWFVRKLRTNATDAEEPTADDAEHADLVLPYPVGAYAHESTGDRGETSSASSASSAPITAGDRYWDGCSDRPEDVA